MCWEALGRRKETVAVEFLYPQRIAAAMRQREAKPNAEPRRPTERSRGATRFSWILSWRRSDFFGFCALRHRINCARTGSKCLSVLECGCGEGGSLRNAGKKLSERKRENL